MRRSSIPVLLAAAAATALLGACVPKEKLVLAGTGCFLDGIQGATGGPPPQAARSVNVKFVGWAADGPAGAPAETLTAMLVAADGRAFKAGTGKSGIARPDVAAALRRPAAGKAGFEVEGRLAEVTPGEYTVQIVQHFADRDIVCTTAGKLRVQ